MSIFVYIQATSIFFRVMRKWTCCPLVRIFDRTNGKRLFHFSFEVARASPCRDPSSTIEQNKHTSHGPWKRSKKKRTRK